MKRFIFTLFLFGLVLTINAQDAPSFFGENDVLIADYDTKSPVLVSSLWLDEEETEPNMEFPEYITIEDNPFPIDNETEKAAKYVRPEGEWQAVYLRFDQNINFTRTPYLQVMVYPDGDAGGLPDATSVQVRLMNDEGEIAEVGGSRSGLNADEWGVVTVYLGRIKPSEKYNLIAIYINPENDLETETIYYIDQIGFKAPEDGSILPATVFFENFGGYNDAWQNGELDDQPGGEKGTSAVFASIGGFTSGVNWSFVDAAGIPATMFGRTYGMNALYEGPSGGGRIGFYPDLPGYLITDDIDIKDISDMMLSFGFGTQEWWKFNEGIAASRPRIEVSVDGGNFYELFSDSEFLLGTGEVEDRGWGPMDVYEDEVFKLVEFSIVNDTGNSSAEGQTLKLRISYKAGAGFWIDDVWLSGTMNTPTNTPSLNANKITIFPNPVLDVLYSTGNVIAIEVYSLNGSLVALSNSGSVDVSALPKGIYMVKLVSPNETVVLKVLK
jgi:hypothetical protein